MRNGNAVNGSANSRSRNGSGNGAGHAAEDHPETISELTAARLRRLAGRIPPDELSEVWVFPPLEDIDGSDEFHLFTRRMSEGVYRVCAAEFPGDPDGNGTTNGAANGTANGTAAVDGNKAGEPRVTVYGAVPESRVPRLVAGFRDRLGDGRQPLYLPIYGSLERWRLAVGVDAPKGVPDDADAPGEGPSDAPAQSEAMTV